MKLKSNTEGNVTLYRTFEEEQEEQERYDIETTIEDMNRADYLQQHPELLEAANELHIDIY